MIAKNILSVWGAPDNTRLTAKQTSIRLPVHVASRINALCDMYPNKSRTEIISDLLSMALKEIESAFPEHKGKQIGETDEGQPYYEDTGPNSEYVKYANKHYSLLEKELGNKNPKALLADHIIIDDSNS